MSLLSLIIAKCMALMASVIDAIEAALLIVQMLLFLHAQRG